MSNKLLTVLAFALVIAQTLAEKKGLLAPCWSDSNCAGNLVCRSVIDEEVKEDLRCRHRIKENEPCFESKECEFGLMCTALRSYDGSEKLCHKPSALGQFCQTTFHCNSTNVVCRPTAEKLTCQTKGLVGAICDGENDCNGTLVCRKNAPTDFRQKCLEKGVKGESCQFKSDCATDLTCRPSSYAENAPYQCLPKSKEGENCVSYSDCEEGLKCRGSFTEPKMYCSPSGPGIGAYCRQEYWGWGYRDCDDTDADVCRRTKLGGMTTCRKYALDGQYCDRNQDCQDNMKCKKDALGRGKCGYRKTQNDECWSNSDCPPWLTCRIPGPTKNVWERFCLPKLKLSKFCYQDSDCESEVCLKRSTSMSRACQTRQAVGTKCDESSHCAEGLSCRKENSLDEDSKCLKRKPVGSKCTYHDECEEKLDCYKEECVKRGTGYGASCEDSWECKGELVCSYNKCDICRNDSDCPKDMFCKDFKCLPIEK